MSARFFKQQRPIKLSRGKTGDGLAFRWYDPNKKVLGKRMEDHLRFSVAYWHSFAWDGRDMFGGETFMREWMHMSDEMEAAKLKADVAFEMFRLLGVPFFAFHDRDIAPEGKTLAESNRNVRVIGEVFAEKMEKAKVRRAVGHRQHVHQPPLHGGRGDQSRSGRVCLCRGAGEERPGTDPRAEGRQLRAVGRPRGLRDPAQHQPPPGIRAAWPLPDHGRRAQAQDRLQGHHPHRAQAEGADQAPV